jgi:hypothetical protein
MNMMLFSACSSVNQSSNKHASAMARTAYQMGVVIFAQGPGCILIIETSEGRRRAFLVSLLVDITQPLVSASCSGREGAMQPNMLSESSQYMQNGTVAPHPPQESHVVQNVHPQAPGVGGYADHGANHGNLYNVSIYSWRTSNRTG